MRSRLAISLVALAMLLQPALAQDKYPSRPIKIVVPMPAGSAPDIRVRIVGEQLSKTIGQPVVIENRPGGGGIIGTQAVLSATPDGYTLLAASASIFTILPVQKGGLPFDVGRDLVPIGTMLAEAQIVAVSPKLGIGSLSELIARAKQQPDAIMIGTNPAGSLPHLAAKLIVARSKAPMTIVPFSAGGSNEVIREIMGGRIHVVIDGRPGLKAAIDSGELRPLAIMTGERLPSVPDLPAAAETIADLRAVGWFALCAPKGTPSDVVRTIENALRDALAAPELLKRVEQIGTPFKPLFGSDLIQFIKGEQDLWKPIVSGG